MTKKKPIHIMDIPVGGMTFKIYACPDGLGIKRSFVKLGNCDFTKFAISLNLKDAATDEEICYILFHELMHAAIDATTCAEKINPHSESFVHPLTRMFWGALVHAGLINDWWKSNGKKKFLLGSKSNRRRRTK